MTGGIREEEEPTLETGRQRGKAPGPHGGHEANPMGEGERPYRRGIRVNLGQFLHQILQVFFVGLMIGMERNVLPSLAHRDFGVAPASLLFLLSFIFSFGLVKSALNFAGGTLADRIGRKPVLILGWCFGIPVPFLILWAPDWWWIVGANVFLGVNQALAWTMTVTSKIDITRPGQRGFATGINEFAGYLAVGVSGVATGYLASLWGARPALFVWGLAVCLLALATALLFVRETLFWAKAEHADYQENRSFGPRPRFPKGVPDQSSAGAIFLLVSFRHPTFRALSQAGVANKVADTLVWAIVPLFFRRQGLDIVSIGWITGLYAMVWGVAQLGTGVLSDRIGRKPVIVSGLWCLALGILGTVESQTKAFWCFWAVVMGLGMALLYPNLIAAVADISPAVWRGKALGTYRFWRDFGYAIGAVVLGAAGQWTQRIPVLFWITAGLLFVSGLWVAFGSVETHPLINPDRPDRDEPSPLSGEE